MVLLTTINSVLFFFLTFGGAGGRVFSNFLKQWVAKIENSSDSPKTLPIVRKKRKIFYPEKQKGEKKGGHHQANAPGHHHGAAQNNMSGGQQSGYPNAAHHQAAQSGGYAQNLNTQNMGGYSAQQTQNSQGGANVNYAAANQNAQQMGVSFFIIVGRKKTSFGG